MEPPTPGPDRDLRVGSRVVVRHRLEVPDPVSGATLSDLVGELVAADATALVVATRHGDVRVRRSSVTAAKAIPPKPSRRGAPHRALSVEDLQRVMVGAWPAMETARLGDWVLRSSRGFTQRGNSVVTVGSPGLPVAAALDHVESWYAVRGSPPNLTVAGPEGADPADDPVGAEALTRGYTSRVPTLTLTAATRHVAHGPAVGESGSQDLVVEVGESLTDRWFTAFRAYRDVDEVAARATLTGSPAQAFATASDTAGNVIGIGRLGLCSAWGGVAAMWVAPGVRRRGLGSRLLVTLARAAEARGAASMHLQVDADNLGALALYQGHGFGVHHAYVNLSRARG